MLIAAVALYFYTKSLLENEIEEELYSNKDRVERLLVTNPKLYAIPPIIVVEKSDDVLPALLKDTLIYDPLQDEVELFRQLSGTKKVNGMTYKITVRAMVIESENILYAIVFIFLTLIFIAFVFIFYLNKSRNAKLWKPFFVNLDNVKAFSIKSENPLKLEESDIIEFDELNQELTHLTSKVQIDYRNLKQFTEDVSHEMQTPLAIMQAKIETMFNDNTLNDSQYEQLSSLQSDIRRLKLLNKRLILLAKIENEQFTSEEIFVLNDLIEEILNNFKELTPSRFTIESNFPLKIKMDKYLAQILCTNLISNAVKYNQRDASILINYTKNTFKISNTGDSALKQPEYVFDRFYKESSKKDSSGLGLSIVKKICDRYGFKPSYSFQENLENSTNQGYHQFEVTFIPST